jgi:hypothetical protein
MAIDIQHIPIIPATGMLISIDRRIPCGKVRLLTSNGAVNEAIESRMLWTPPRAPIGDAYTISTHTQARWVTNKAGMRMYAT